MLRLPQMVLAETKRAAILEGRVTAEEIKKEVAQEVLRLRDQHGVKPCLAAVLVGDDAASAVYVRNKVRACAEVGIASEELALAASTTTEDLFIIVGKL